MREPTNSLSASLRKLRKEAGLSGTEAARRASLSQAKISRTEIGKFMPTAQQVDALCRVYNAPSEQRKQLVGMARELAEGRIGDRVVFERGGWLLQERVGRIEELAGTLRSVNPSGVMPGLLQTRDYARALFGDTMTAEDLERTVDARLARQSLLDTGREFQFVLTEGPLRFNIGGAAVMNALLSQIIDLSQKPNVHVGVIPSTTSTTVPAVNPFHLYDQRAVLVGTHTASALLTNEQDVSGYQQQYNELATFVTWDDDARSVIADITAEYQRRS